MSLARKIILIVAGSSGIGFAVAQASLEQKAVVILASSDPEARLNGGLAK